VAASVWLALRRSADTTPNSSETLRQIILKATVLREALLMVLAGLALGLPTALATARLLRSQLHGLGPYDPVTMLFAAGVMTGVAVLACYPPVTRAMRIDPMAALRYE
jgi:ABC-type antimicrobial peptide transport system permease subunit